MSTERRRECRKRRVLRAGRSGPDRRAFLLASASGFAGLHFGRPGPALAGDGDGPSPTAQGGRAKSVILFFLCGGASHIDTWDMKPDAPAEYRGPFREVGTSAGEIRLCEHLPLLAEQSRHLAVIRSVNASVNTNDHHAGYYYNLTGHEADPTFLSQGNDRRPQPDDWPYMGSVVASRRPQQGTLPNALTLPHMPSPAPYTRPGQFAAKLGVEFDPLYVFGSGDDPLRFEAPSLMLTGDVTKDQLRARKELLGRLDQARRDWDHQAQQQLWKSHQNRALDLLLSSQTTTAFDVAQESEATRARYGDTINATSLLLARRLVEAEVPFVTVFWKGDDSLRKKCRSAGSWDTHGNNFDCLREDLLPEFDRAFSALLADLHDRGLLESTLVLVTSEMGRKPKIGDPRSGGASGAGRDHWTHCQSVLMAGGGVRGGQTYGSSDRLGEYPDQNPVTPADIAKTVYWATGTDDLIATDSQGRPFNLLEQGEPIASIF